MNNNTLGTLADVKSNRSRNSQQTSFEYSAFARALTAWFAHAQRDLLWRREENARDPYRVLVSEVMLQQTTVAAVVPFYRKFLARFPDAQTLAAAPLEDVLAHWAGLGYYSRARNLHACARAIVEKHAGAFPRELEGVLALPGVGRYTAGAVTSIAFDAPSPIVDANVARVFSRIFCLEGDLKNTANQRRLWSEAERVVQSGAKNNCPPSQLNPALMELGALICIPKTPRCKACPVQNFCAAFAAGRQNELPFITPKAAPTPLHDVCALACRENSSGEMEILLRQRPHDAKIWWRGMWELPRATVAVNQTPHDALQGVLRDIGVQAKPRRVLTSVTHGVTRFHITLDCWEVEVEQMSSFSGQWTTLADAEALAMPASMRRVLRWLQKHHWEEQQLTLL